MLIVSGRPNGLQAGHSDSTTLSRGTSILERMDAYSSQASEHRLNQRPKNVGLQKASQVNEATAALKRQNRIETLNLYVSIFLCPPDKSKAAKKVCVQCKQSRCFDTIRL